MRGSDDQPHGSYRFSSKLKFMETKKIQVQKSEISEYDQQKSSVETMISQAIQSGVSVETMERILAMRKELKAEYAKEQFDKAMSAFQAECPEIKKTKTVKTKEGINAYSYAPIESIVRQVKGLLGKNGLSYSIQTKTLKDEKGGTLVKSICTAKHILGHSESSDMEVPLGYKTNVMSDSQVVAAASTFAKRYAFCNIFGIMTGDEDDEENLKGVSVQEAIDNFSRCMDIPQFNKAWASLPKELKANKEVIIYVKKIKENIANENLQNASKK